MAFCTSCGAKLDDNVRFCPGCGKPAQASTLPLAASIPPVTATSRARSSTSGGSAAAQPSAYAAPVVAAPAPPASGGSALKIILIIAGVFVLLIVMAVAGLIYVGYRAKKAFNVTTTEGNAAQVAANLGVEAYPGAKPLRGSGATVTLGGVTVGGAQFETDDPVGTVVEFYRAKYPNSSISAGNGNEQSLIVSSDKSFVTISIGERAGRTRISISRMAGSPPPR